MSAGDNTVDPVIKPKSLFNTDAVLHLCYEVALLKEVANHCVLEGGAAHLHTNTSVLSQDAVSDEPFQNIKKTKPAELHTVFFSFSHLHLKDLVYYFPDVIYCELY